MDRRRYLALVAGSVATGLAGCTGDGGGGTTATTDRATPTATATATATATPTTTRTTTATTTGDDGETAEAIGTAKDHLDAAGEEIARQSDSFGDVEGTNFDDSEVRRELDATDAALDRAAGSDPTDDQRETVEALRRFADALSALTSAMVSLGRGFDAFESGQSALDVERYEVAIDHLETARSRFSTAQNHLDTARDRIAAVDEARLAGEGVDLGTVRDAVEELDGLLSAMDPFVGGYVEFVRGQSNFEAGSSAMDAEDFDTAASRFGSARDRYDRAAEGFADAAEAARAAEDAEMQANLERLVCLARALRDGSGHLVDAAAAYEAGDTGAGNDAADRASEDFGRCDNGTEEGTEAVLRAARAVVGA